MDVMWIKDMGYKFLGSWLIKLSYGNKNILKIME